ncbi:MAG: alpha-amylase family glycosyl hydrolase [Ruminobacter sp.]|nr:alpha-amylase family glycosyl hydrolase [Ruminobacter sp.]
MNLHYKSLLSASILMALTACGGSSSSDGDSPTPTPSEEISVTINNVNTSDYDNNRQACNQTSAKTKKDFCNLRIYQVMVESFQDGDSNIGYGTGYGTSHHKGDLKGIIKSLDYIKDLGMNAIWLTPIFDSSKKVSNNDNKLDATGYFANSYKEIDPNFGTKDDLKTLVEEAHARGIYVFLDGVFGHSKSNVDTTSPNNERLVTTNKCIGSDGNEYDNDISARTCSDFKDKDNQSQNNEFFKDVATHYIKEYKIDGWRLDQAYQLPVDSWKEIREAVEKAASQTTYTMNNKEVNPLGYMVGEIWSGNQQINNWGYGAKAGDGLLSVFAFNLRYAIVQTLAVEEDWKKSNHKGTHLLKGFRENANELTANTYSNLFITNHDVVRFGDLIQRAKKNGQLKELLYSNRAKAALSLLATYSGPITNYYGEEIGQEVPNFDVSEKNGCSNKGLCDDHVSRDSGKITGFNETEQALHDYMANLMNVRSKLPSLYNGTLNVLKVDDNLFSMLKKDITTTKNLDAIYLLNVNEKVTIKADISSNLDDKDYSELVDVATCETFKAESENVTVKLEPLQNRILVSEATANEIGVCNN